ncbi:ABC transporter ATP-binding protein [Rathayibacter soli]|uniref:ABC transporter ATP-binding protein n=1 Tax=Rathayibacter soli TaxID=3144168 RepID=UPI0027E43F2D|nr:ABC transporter ATP-binding protein [Glaciibacter superstes]
MTNAIAVHGVTRTFGRIKALNDLSFAVAEGSILGLLGRNGAGKTTIMSIIAGQDRPSSGGVEVLGAAPFENASVLSQISYVRDNQRYPDDYKLHHVLRIAPDFAPNWNADVAAELVDGFRIPGKARIKKLSRGQLSSIAIVLGIASRSPVTLLDEPYLGLDITARALFHDVLIRDYAAHPRTIVLSTHLIEESERLFDHVVIIDRGTVVADSPTDELQGLAFTVSGTADAVGRLAAGRTVLRSHAIGGLRSVTVRGGLDDTMRADARAAGVQVAPVTLPELVVAFGEYEPDSSEKPRRSGSARVGAPAEEKVVAGADASGGLVAAGEPTAAKKGTH